MQPDEVRLRHMLDAARKATIFVQGRSRADLDTDELLALALVRLLEIVGEAAKYVSQPTKDRAPQIPWRQIAGTRDRLIHGYFAVDMDLLWVILNDDLPPLIEAVRALLASET